MWLILRPFSWETSQRVRITASQKKSQIYSVALPPNMSTMTGDGRTGLLIGIFMPVEQSYDQELFVIISYLLRFSDRIDRMKNSYGNFFIQSQSRNDFLTLGKNVSSSQKSSVKIISQFAARSRCCWRLFNLLSQNFIEFPQVYSSFLANYLWTTDNGGKFEQVYCFR